MRVIRPRFASLAIRDRYARLGRLNPALATLRFYTDAALRAIRSLPQAPDALYGHFLLPAGAAAVRIGVSLGIPAFPCIGEGELWTVRPFGTQRAHDELIGAQGFIANSSALRQMAVRELGLAQDSIGVFPNGADLSRFYPRDQATARARFGLPLDRFLVVAVGNFLEKKGIARVAQAIDGLEGVSGVYVGSGPVPPRASNTVFCGRVDHEDMPELLSACDLFVLPTVVEGSCNAIIEAMACGLPVVSSWGEHNDDLLTDDMAARVDPMDIDEVRRAVQTLHADRRALSRMARASAERAKLFSVDERAAHVLAFVSTEGQR